MRTVDEQVIHRVTMDEEFGTASVQRVTRWVDTITGEQIGPEQYHRHVVEPDADDTDESPAVQRARATFITQEMIDRRVNNRVPAGNPNQGNRGRNA